MKLSCGQNYQSVLDTDSRNSGQPHSMIPIAQAEPWLSHEVNILWHFKNSHILQMLRNCSPSWNSNLLLHFSTLFQWLLDDQAKPLSPTRNTKSDKLQPKYFQAQNSIVLLLGKITFSLTEKIIIGPLLYASHFAFPSPKDFGEIYSPKYLISSSALLTAVLGILFG